MNEKALEKILNIFLEKVLPLTEKGVARGNKIFGDAIIKREQNRRRQIWMKSGVLSQSNCALLARYK